MAVVGGGFFAVAAVGGGLSGAWSLQETPLAGLCLLSVLGGGWMHACCEQWCACWSPHQHSRVHFVAVIGDDSAPAWQVVEV